MEFFRAEDHDVNLLFPVTLISEATIEAAEAAEPSDDLLRLAVADQTTIMLRRLAARQAA